MRKSLRPKTTGKPPAGAVRRKGPAVWVAGAILLHLPLALAMKHEPILAAIHALVTFVVGLWFCCRKNHPLALAQWAGYTTGAEALWRMCGAPIPWEFAELSVCLVLLISLIRKGGIPASWLPVLYLGLLVPACFATLVLLSLEEARQQISFYIAPPAALALCAICFSKLQLNPAALQRIGLAVIMPIAGMAVITFLGVTTANDQFGTSSNFAASGGYGPNQVSAILSLGALMVVFVFVGAKHPLWIKVALVALGVWLMAQSLLTFSRTGLYLFAASFVVSAPFLGRTKGQSLHFLLLLLALALSACALLPSLNAFTGGLLLRRFENPDLTGRDTIAEAELQLWLRKPILGNGVGMSMYGRSEMNHEDAPPAHTEYTRLLAEHGLLGAAALVVLLVMTAQAFLGAPGSWAKAIVTAMAVWSFLFMAVSDMRLVAPAFLLGLIHARFRPYLPTATPALVNAQRLNPSSSRGFPPRAIGAGASWPLARKPRP